MVKRKNLTSIAILLSAFLMALPIYNIPIARATGPTLSVQPATLVADLGAQIPVDVMVSDVSSFCAYDFRLLYDTSVLDVASASLTGTAFDSHPHLVVRQDVFEGLGEVRYAVTLLGVPGIDIVGSQSLLHLSLQVTKLDVSDLTIRSDTLVSCFGGETSPISHDTSNGLYIPPPSVGLRSVACRASNPGLNINAHGNHEDIFCRVENSGSADAVIRIDFSYLSVGGASGLVSSPVMTLAAGQLATLTATITVAVAFDVFIVQGTMIRIVTTPDGRVLEIPGDSHVFKFNVRVCTSGACL